MATLEQKEFANIVDILFGCLAKDYDVVQEAKHKFLFEAGDHV